jgi:hypothetical protein
MKIGDLVEISAKGKHLLYCNYLVGKIGIVVELKPQEKWTYYIQVSWMGGPARTKHLRSTLKLISHAPDGS